jgi:hypothetical protein
MEGKADRLKLVVAALAIGIGTVGAVNLGFSLMTARPMAATSVAVVEVVIVAMPFLFLALSRISARPPWLTGLALTFGLWGYYLFEGVRTQLSGETSGANIGLGLLMLASPFIIIAACLTVHFQFRRSQS